MEHERALLIRALLARRRNARRFLAGHGDG
jgi:hypothetical protein